MGSDDKAHMFALREEYIKRLQVLELQEARYGKDCPAHIIVEIHELKVKIEEIDDNSRIFEVIWDGEWSELDGDVYSLQLKLNMRNKDNISGSIIWILLSSPWPRLQSKVGLEAVEYVHGVYIQEQRKILLEGYDADDPERLISLDRYTLTISVDGNTLNGITYNHKNWTGKILAQKRKQSTNI